jgi:hypothetical protein
MTTPAEPRKTLTREEELERALDAGGAQLPPNKPLGMLGEQGLNLRKVDDHAPTMDAGISQEMDWPVLWLAIVLGYLLFFVPGFAILWFSKGVPIRVKIRVSIVGLLGVAAFFYWFLTR